MTSLESMYSLKYESHDVPNSYNLSALQTETDTFVHSVDPDETAHKINCGYSLEPPGRGGSNENPQSFFLDRNLENWKISDKKNYDIFHIAFLNIDSNEYP